ncbi:DUF2188 domain-containing protein [Domibacillus sp. DTU_2020_1001157_1_SI_ALB_TIR_016]|uniref:DUF2188 domain-containing protein n=1 Tax=Domibacillus sp. DTU_2020_1001157_1_SI_ALB_TIR_016 TaxID=3077789 RepID=UPI0028E63201|nr:DUF2188 domain-containing protein [Domibacillus sp. DTU_2020_1001157_1_SI_ALB_TIR_016]WNS82399.1 DUF2188 domain-containing protein [Domibacillus sp. DTU_2020_1001157_1_SI_ALB_TIR_016]
MAENHRRNEYFEDRAGTDEARFHVVPHGDGEWAVKTEGKDEPNDTFGSKSEAVDEAKKMAEEAGTMAIIHDEDGQIEKQHNFQS